LAVLRDLRVFVEQAAESVASADPEVVPESCHPEDPLLMSGL
jgi:hypothetical protein